MKKYYVFYQYPEDKNRYSLIDAYPSLKEAKENYNENYIGYICNYDGKVLKRYRETKEERTKKIGINFMNALARTFKKTFEEEGKVLHVAEL